MSDSVFFIVGALPWVFVPGVLSVALIDMVVRRTSSRRKAVLLCWLIPLVQWVISGLWWFAIEPYRPSDEPLTYEFRCEISAVLGGVQFLVGLVLATFWSIKQLSRLEWCSETGQWVIKPPLNGR